MTTERDPRTRTVLSWLREDTHENPERMLLRALDEVDTTPQRRSWWPAWRDVRMNKVAMTATTLAAALVVTVVGYNLLPGLGIMGPGATPSASPTLLARGTFVAGYTVDIEAFARGSSVTGRMTVTEGESGPSFNVELDCTRTTPDGSILIGGVTTDTTTDVAPEGTYAALALKPGPPVRAAVWSQRGGGRSQAPSCLAYLDEQSWRLDMDAGFEPIEGTIELRANAATPSEAPASAGPSSSVAGSLPIGPYVMGSRSRGVDRVTLTIPAPGWFAPDGESLTKDLGGDNRVTVVVVRGDYYTAPANICNWQNDDVVGRPTDNPGTADEFVAYIAAQTYDWPGGSLPREFSAPEDITIDGSHGQRIVNTVRAYPDSDPNACAERRFCTLQDRDGAACLLSHQEPGALDTLWIVDQPAYRNYLLVVASSGTPSTALRDEVNTLVNSITFYVE